MFGKKRDKKWRKVLGLIIIEFVLAVVTVPVISFGSGVWYYGPLAWIGINVILILIYLSDYLMSD